MHDKKITKAYESLKIRTVRHSHNDYCPACRKRREHVKVVGYKMCKTCGHQEHSLKFKY